MLKIFYTISLLTIGLSIAYANNSVNIGATRLVYDSSKSTASVAVSNIDSKAYLIQSWVTKDPMAEKSINDLFITTPPLFQLDPKTDNSVRVVYINNGQGLPQDRESVFWLNIKAIPLVEYSDNNKLTIAVKTQIKLFYRPTGLIGNVADSYKSLKFSTKNGKLTINNPTPYSVTLSTLKINGTNVDTSVMVLPFSIAAINENISAGAKVSWQAINDFGGITDEQTANVEN